MSSSSRERIQYINLHQSENSNNSHHLNHCEPYLHHNLPLKAQKEGEQRRLEEYEKRERERERELLKEDEEREKERRAWREREEGLTGMNILYPTFCIPLYILPTTI